MREPADTRLPSSRNPRHLQLRHRLLRLIVASEADRRSTRKIEADFARSARMTT
jgi:hypothetical protein